MAPHVGRVCAVDVQSETHDHYREKGVPGGVELVMAGVADVPLDDASLDAAFSTVTFHEFASDGALAAVARTLRPGGRLVTVDWSARGVRETGPPHDERCGLGEAATMLGDAGFSVVHGAERGETFVCVARPH